MGTIVGATLAVALARSPTYIIVATPSCGWDGANRAGGTARTGRAARHEPCGWDGMNRAGGAA